MKKIIILTILGIGIVIGIIGSFIILGNTTKNTMRISGLQNRAEWGKKTYQAYRNENPKVGIWALVNLADILQEQEKIFKIIDFGRAIYKYKGKLICSDSFHKDGDAATQYNFEPYYNDRKPIIEPNYSFDLCRLGCSIYDFIMEKYESLDDDNYPIDED